MNETVFDVMAVVMTMFLIEKLAAFLLINCLSFKISFKQYFRYKVISGIEVLAVMYATAAYLSRFAAHELFPLVLGVVFLLLIFIVADAYKLRYKMLDWDKEYLFEVIAIDGTHAVGVFWHDGVRFDAWMCKTEEIELEKRYYVYVAAVSMCMPRSIRVEQRA